MGRAYLRQANVADTLVGSLGKIKVLRPPINWDWLKMNPKSQRNPG